MFLPVALKPIAGSIAFSYSHLPTYLGSQRVGACLLATGPFELSAGQTSHNSVMTAIVVEKANT